MKAMRACCILVLALCSQASQGQGRDSSRPIHAVERVRLTSRLSEQTVARVHSVFGTIVVDHPRLSGDTIEYASARPDGRFPASSSLGTGAGRLPLTDVRLIEVRGSAAGRGAKIGAITLGIVGLGLGIALATCDQSDFLCGESGSGEKFVGALALTAGGVVVGGVIGGLVGAPFRRWKAVYSIAR